MTVTQSNPRSGEQSSFFADRKRELALVATLGIGSIALAGCASNNTEAAPQPSVDTAYTGEVVDTPEDTTPELITNYKALSWEAYNSNPQSERLKYVDYRLENGIDLHTELLSGKDKPGYVDLSASSTPQEIVDHFIYVQDEANYQFEIDTATGDKLHDENEGIKLLSGAFLRVEGDGRSNIFQGAVDRHLKNASDKPFVDETRLTATGAEIKTGILDGQEVTYQDISFYGKDGNNSEGRWVYVEYPGFDGSTEDTWLLDQTFSPEEPIADY